MGLLITNSLPLSIGESKTNLWAKVTFHTQELLITGKVQCDLSFYKSEADHDAGADKVYPLVDGQKITNCTINVGLNDEVKASGQSLMSDVVSFFYAKVEAYMESNFTDEQSPAQPWSVTIQ